MKTVGVDLAAEPANTAVAELTWHSDFVSGVVNVGCTDGQIKSAAKGASKMGIDCPLGWPDEFVDFVVAHRAHARIDRQDKSAREPLANRLTDLVLAKDPAMPNPLSVSTDRIGRAAMRVAGLLTALGDVGLDIDRAGAGHVVEAYPAAALRVWGFGRSSGYKGSAGRDARADLVAELQHKLRRLDLGSHAATCVGSDHALDAVVCALIARAAVLGHVTTPDQTQLARARTEGWIAVPTGDLAALIG